MAEKKKKEKKDKVLIVIPYCSARAQGREIEYAVAGWRRHFKEDYLIVLAGEDHPVTKTGDDIICVESERVPPSPGNYRQHLDYVSCFKKVREAFPWSKGFIFVADDVYAVNDFDLADVKLLKMQSPKIEYADFPFDGSFPGDKSRTAQALKKGGYPIRNFTTHLPQWFEWDKLAALWEKFDMENVSYIFEDLYYNMYYPERIPLKLDIRWDNFKCGIYRDNPDMGFVRTCLKTKIWIQNSEVGWIPELDKLLDEYYFGSGKKA